MDINETLNFVAYFFLAMRKLEIGKQQYTKFQACQFYCTYFKT